MNMKLILSASLLALAGVASAQSVMEITDPAKIAEIERHAQQLGAQPMAQSGGRMDHMDRMDRMDRMRGKHRMHARMRHHRKMMEKRAEMKAMPDAGAMPPAQN